MGRDQGRRKQSELWKIWGGPPTTHLLRFRSSANRVILARRRSKLERLTGYSLPSEQQEAADPAGADQHYEAAVSFLLEASRDTSRFPLLFAESINYGFRRNLWGLKPVGVAVALFAAICSWGIFVASVDLMAWKSWVDDVIRNPEVAVVSRLIGAILNTAIIVLWLLVITPEWVRAAAEAYAQRLLGSIDVLDSTSDGESRVV